jgi:hypothetical protein
VWEFDMPKKFLNFQEFYPFYLDEHRRFGTRFFHFLGTTGFFLALIASVYAQNAILLGAGIVFAYAMAWISHFFIEKNRPATFSYPLYSLRADFKLYFDLLSRRQKFSTKN